MIYLDQSVALPQLLAEDQRPPAWLWDETLAASRLLEYELWTREHARKFARSHSGAWAAGASCTPGTVGTGPDASAMGIRVTVSEPEGSASSHWHDAGFARKIETGIQPTQAQSVDAAVGRGAGKFMVIQQRVFAE